MSSNKYSKEDCLNALAEAKERLGHDPSQNEYKNLDISPSYQTIADKFGRWNIAKKTANMSENRPSHLKYQDGCPDILTYSDSEWESLDKNVRFRRRTQAYVAKRKIDSKCEKCGYNKNPTALEYHHIDKENKFMDISTMITQGYSTDRIEDEIEKCIVLCSNCHSVQELGHIYDV